MSIANEYLLDDEKVIPEIKECIKKIAAEIKFYLNESIKITSAHRVNDKKYHGQGKAVDFKIIGVHGGFHIHEYADIAYQVCKAYSISKKQVTEFGMYEGMKTDAYGKKYYTQHIHIAMGDNRKFIAVYTGKYQ